MAVRLPVAVVHPFVEVPRLPLAALPTTCQWKPPSTPAVVSGTARAANTSWLGSRPDVGGPCSYHTTPRVVDPWRVKAVSGSTPAGWVSTFSVGAVVLFGAACREASRSAPTCCQQNVWTAPVALAGLAGLAPSAGQVGAAVGLTALLTKI